MNSLTSNQARDLAQQYHNLSRNLGDYRFQHFDALSAEQRQTIEDFEWDLLTMSSQFNRVAIDMQLADIEPLIQRIVGVADQLNAKLKRLQLFDKVIGIATRSVQLAGAIVSGSPVAISSAIQDALALLVI
jgi:hypothetical protein